MGPNALIGVHSANENGEETFDSMAYTTRLARDAAAYAVPDAIIGKLVQTEPGRMAWLTPTDLKPMGVVLTTPSSPEAPLPPPQAAPTTQATPANTQYVIQVGSKQTAIESIALFADMQRRYASLLAQYRPIVQKADLTSMGQGVWYRLRVGSFADKDAANALCEKLKADGGNCFLAK